MLPPSKAEGSFHGDGEAPGHWGRSCCIRQDQEPFHTEAVLIKLLCVYVALTRLYPALEHKIKGEGKI